MLVFIQSRENLTVPNMRWKVNQISTDYRVPAEIRAMAQTPGDWHS